MMSALTKMPPLLGSARCSQFLGPRSILKPQVAGMITKALRDKDFKRPYAFPYKLKPYKFLDSIFDQTTWRFDENSKLIVVDGPFCSGKDKCAKKIAEEFDLFYIPHAHLDSFYVNSYGQDLRQLNDLLPLRIRSFDTHEFLANPKDERAVMMQMHFMEIRLSQYLDALSHILNTGQGVVMNRSFFSDLVFVNTFIKCGFLPETYREWATASFDVVKPDLFRPHLVVYLDTPVDVIRKNLKKRGNPVEINSPVYQPEVLAELEKTYKHQFLKEMNIHSELLVYDCTEELDYDIVVEDIERVNLDDYGKYDEKMIDWRLVDEWAYNERRMAFSSRRQDIEDWLFHIPYFKCKEGFVTGEERLILTNALATLPGSKYSHGFNKDMGDDNLLFKYT